MGRKMAMMLVVVGLAVVGAGLWYRSTQAEFCARNVEQFGGGLGACEPGQGMTLFVVGGALALVGAVVAVMMSDRA